MASSSAKKNTAIANATAKLQIQIAKEMHDVWKNHYKQIDEKAIAEYESDPVAVLNYDDEQGRFMTTVKARFKDAFITLERCYSPFSTGYNQLMLSNLSKAQTRAIGDSVMSAYKLARLRNEALNDVRHNRSIELIGLGRGVIRQAGSYASTAGAGASSMARQADQSTGNALKAVGYLLNRDYTNANVPKYDAQVAGKSGTRVHTLDNQNISSETTFPVGRGSRTTDLNLDYNRTPQATQIPNSNATDDISLIDSITNIFKG